MISHFQTAMNKVLAAAMFLEKIVVVDANP